jgi:hypothetical protein
MSLAGFWAGAGAGGANLPAAAPTSYCSGGTLNGAPIASQSDPSVAAVVTYLQRNLPQQDGTSSAITPATLTDCNAANGEVFHGKSNNAGGWTASVNDVTVISPRTTVNFGLARVIGANSTTVASTATVEIDTPLYSTLPFYGYTGCDYGSQTIANPTNGQSTNGVLLYGDSAPYNLATETDLQTNPLTAPVVVPLDDTTHDLVLTGSGFLGATAIGFYESGSTSAGPAPTVLSSVGTGPGQFSINALGTKITVHAPLPAAVTGVQDTWYVRVKNLLGWSRVYTGTPATVLNALPFNVGTVQLNCGQGSNAGNFGTVKLSNSRQNGQWQQIAQNIATGLDSTLGPFTGAASPWTCSDSSAGAKVWTTAGTNCVLTKTGLDSNAATSGFITGQGISAVNGVSSLLTQGLTNNTTGCNGLPATNTMLNTLINNDTLSCFFTDPTTNVGDVDRSTYTLPGKAFSQNIWNSPRFVNVPVLGTQPAGGANNDCAPSDSCYEIVGFRAGFITDQPNSATKTTPANCTNTATDCNGIVTAGNAVQSVQIIFLNDAAVPSPPPGAVKGFIQYVGSGQKVPVLIQ